jgi:hypothetical protein
MQVASKRSYFMYSLTTLRTSLLLLLATAYLLTQFACRLRVFCHFLTKNAVCWFVRKQWIEPDEIFRDYSGGLQFCFITIMILLLITSTSITKKSPRWGGCMLGAIQRPMTLKAQLIAAHTFHGEFPLVQHHLYSKPPIQNGGEGRSIGEAGTQWKWHKTPQYFYYK